MELKGYRYNNDEQNDHQNDAAAAADKSEESRNSIQCKFCRIVRHFCTSHCHCGSFEGRILSFNEFEVMKNFNEIVVSALKQSQR